MTTLTQDKVTKGITPSQDGELPVAADIAVHIHDYSQNVPGTDMRVWKYREVVDADYQPGSDFPVIKTEPFPSRRADLGESSIQALLERNSFSQQPPVVQALGRGAKPSLDLRRWNTTRWDNKLQRQVELPPEEHTCYDGIPGGLFLNTVHNCFDRHYALGIRPECLMWMIMHEVGITVRQNPEAYRDFFTTSSEKQHIEVINNDLRLDQFDQQMSWASSVGDLYEELRMRVPSDVIDDMMPAISTHDFDSQVASMVAVLDAATPYFSYGMTTCCGIPQVRLFGHSQDYDNMVAAATMLSEKFSAHLGQYFKYLLPVLQEIADTAAGRKKPDNEFWSSIYKQYSASGTDDMDGWITAFVNYVNLGEGYKPKAEELYDWEANLEYNNGGAWPRGLPRSELPQHLSMVPFEWTYLVDPSAPKKFDCRLVGGFLGVDDVDGFATPSLSYAVLRGDEVAV